MNKLEFAYSWISFIPYLSSTWWWSTQSNKSIFYRSNKDDVDENELIAFDKHVIR